MTDESAVENPEQRVFDLSKAWPLDQFGACWPKLPSTERLPSAKLTVNPVRFFDGIYDGIRGFIN